MKRQPAQTIRLAMLFTALVLAHSLTASLAQAQDSGFYLGVGAGSDRADINTQAVFAGIKASGAISAGTSSYDRDTVSKLFVGYRFNQYVGLELGQVDLGTLGYEASAGGTAVQRGEASLDATTLDLLATLPMADRATGFLRLGAGSMDIGQVFSNPGLGAAFTNGSGSATNAHFGTGVEVWITDSFSARLEWEAFRLADNRVLDSSLSALTASVFYRFGASKPAPASQAASAEPVPVQPTVTAADPRSTPAPAPLPVPAPAAASATTLLSLTLDASTLFDLNSAGLKDAGKEQIDQLVRDLASVSYDAIAVTGHTDRLGPPDLNQRLSTQRADAVRDYLIGAGIAAASITARGLSNERPITTLEQCPGERSPALIVCLQPDRRVEVQVSGTRAP
jgi:OOP family OmpA-OmpF porin